MQQEEALTTRSWPVAPIQAGDTLLSCRHEFSIAIDVLAGRVGPVRQQREVEVPRGACQIVDLQPGDQFPDIRDGGQESWHGHQRAEIPADSAAQRHRRQERGAKPLGHKLVHDGDSDVHRRDQSQNCKDEKPSRA